MKSELEKIIDTKEDSVRIYRLGSTYQNKIEVIGRKSRVETGEPLIIVIIPRPIFPIHISSEDRRMKKTNIKHKIVVYTARCE